MNNSESIRADKWLWVCRFFKTRLLSGKMIKFGKIRVNGRKLTKVSSSIRKGDVITLTKNNEILVVRVLSWPVRRGSAKNLQDWYENI